MTNSELHKLVNEYENQNGEDTALDEIFAASGVKRIRYSDEFVEWLVDKYVNLLEEARRWRYKG